MTKCCRLLLTYQFHGLLSHFPIRAVVLGGINITSILPAQSSMLWGWLSALSNTNALLNCLFWHSQLVQGTTNLSRNFGWKRSSSNPSYLTSLWGNIATLSPSFGGNIATLSLSLGEAWFDATWYYITYTANYWNSLILSYYAFM